MPRRRSPPDPPEPEGRRKAREEGRMGWNIRCNRCGEYGARWVRVPHISGGRALHYNLALCPEHSRDVEEMLARHRREQAEATKILYHQEYHEPVRYSYD